MSTEPNQLDPQIVRKVARSAMTLAAQRRDDIDHAILRHGGLGDWPEGGEELRKYRTAYGALYAAVRAEMHTATIAVSWPDERKPANVVTAEQDMCTCNEPRNVCELRTELDRAHGQLKSALAERAALAARIAELEGASRKVVCPVCRRPTKLTATGLIRYHGPHNRPCKGSSILPEVEAE